MKNTSYQRGQILLVDDDEDIRDLLSDYLREHGYAVLVAKDGDRMAWYLQQEKVDLVILDLNLPGKDGLTLCRELRTHSHIPVLILTALSDAIDRIIGLEIGADDYMCKPFEPRELLARVRNILRRVNQVENDGEQIYNFFFADRLLDVFAQKIIFADKTETELSTSEIKLLRLFLENPQRSLKREWLSQKALNRPLDSLDRTVDIQISRLRQKIGDNARKPEIIRTVRNEGYMLMMGVERNVHL